MTDIFERDAYAPGEYERLQAEFDAEARQIVEALVEENTDLDGKVDHDGVLIVLAVKYLTLRYELKRRTVAQSEKALRFSDKPAAWLIVRHSGTGGQSARHLEVVLSPLTDDVHMDEGDEAWPLHTRLSATPSAGARTFTPNAMLDDLSKRLGALVVELLQEHWQDARSMACNVSLSNRDGVPTIAYLDYFMEALARSTQSATGASDLIEACRGLVSYWTRNLRNFQWEKADTHVKRINAAISAISDSGATRK